MPGEALRIPGLLEGRRKWRFRLLLAFTAGEVTAQVAATGALKALLVGATGGVSAAALLVATGLAAAGFGWARNVMGEQFGLDYVNDIRKRLARQAIAVASSGGSGRFGTIAIRMTGDLTALKDWANIGVCGGMAGLLGLVGAVCAALWTAGASGLVAALIGPALALVLCALLVRRLHGEVRERRRQKGRLSARIGDMLLGASASAAYGSQARAIRSVDLAGRAALDAQTRQVAVSSILQLPAMLTLPFGAAAAVLMTLAGLQPTGGVAGWAALLFALSLASLATSLLVGAVIQFVERRIARAKLEELMEMARELPPTAPQGDKRLRAGPGAALSVEDQLIVAAGDGVCLPRLFAEPLLDAILRGEPGVTLDGVAADRVYPIDWARRVAYAGPRRGLTRDRLSLALAARRRADPEALAEALAVAGLPAEWLAEDRLIDPQSPQLTAWSLARLRLARALAHRPRVLIIDDPWLSEDEALMRRVRDWCTARSVSRILVSDADGGAVPRLRTVN